MVIINRLFCQRNDDFSASWRMCDE